MSKMTLELGGSYTAGQAFSKAQSDLKKFGQANKDAIKAGTDSLKELEKGFGEDLGKSIGTAKGVIQGLAQGGLWGAIGAAAGAAIGLVVDWFKQAQENAKQFANTCGEYITNAIKKVGQDFSATQQEIAKAKVEAQDFAQIAQGAIVQSANATIHNLHIETLQKITDNMSQSGRKVVLADEALETAKIKESMVSQLNAEKQAEQQGKIDTANQTLQAARKRLIEIEAEKSNLSIHENEVLQKYTRLRAELDDITRRYKDNMLTANSAATQSAKVQEELNELYEANKGTIDGNKAALEALTAAQKEVSAAEIQYEHEKRAMTLVTQQTQEAEQNARRAVLDATMAKKEAERADREYAAQTAKKTQEEAERDAKKKSLEEEIEKKKKEEIRLKTLKEEFEKQDIEITKECYRLKVNEAQYLALYHRLRIEGLSKEQAMLKLQETYKAVKENEQKITQVCAKYKLDEKEYIKKFNEMTSKGISETDAYAQLQRDLNEELKKRKEAEGKATKAAKDYTKDDDKEGKKKKGLIVSLSTSNMGDLGETVEEKMSFKDWQKKNRDEQRKARDSKNNMKIDQAKMTKALKGEMPEEEARQWMEYAKKKYTPDQMKELGQLAMNKELLSKKEQQDQKKAIMQMAEEIAKSLTIK